ncbi:MAG: mprA 3 [Nocardioides sp.]|nr:mprA 3 [Nocardioides sp.]
MTSGDTHGDGRAPEGSGPARRPAGLRVLVAEDFEPVRTLTTRMLNKLGHADVDEAEDGQEAVDALAAKHYDLLLLDMSMPHLSGMDVVRWLHAHPDRLQGLSIVVVSAAAHEERPMLNELGVTMMLPKPVRIQQLSDVIDAVRASR